MFNVAMELKWLSPEIVNPLKNKKIVLRCLSGNYSLPVSLSVNDHSALVFSLSLGFLSCFVENGRRVSRHRNRRHEPPRMGENQLKASPNSKSKVQNSGVLSQGEASEANGVPGGGGIQTG